MCEKLHIDLKTLLWGIPYVEIHLMLVDFPYYEPNYEDDEGGSKKTDSWKKEKGSKKTSEQKLEDYFNTL